MSWDKGLYYIFVRAILSRYLLDSEILHFSSDIHVNCSTV